MDIYLPIDAAAAAAHMTKGELNHMIESGRIKPAMLATGVLLVKQSEIPRREETEDYRAVAHLRGVGIGLRQGAEKYGVNNVTISNWVARGLIRRLSGETMRGQRVMIDEADLAYCAAIYKRNPGQGKSTLK